MGVAAPLVVAGAVGYGVSAGVISTFTANVLLGSYALYNSSRQRQQARRAYEASLRDQTLTVNSTDVAREVVYGERVVGGRVAYAVEPRDEPTVVDGILRPVNDKFYLVMALTPNHEIEGFHDILFDGQPVGPFAGNLNASQAAGVYVGPDSKFYKTRDSVRSSVGIVPVSGVLNLPTTVQSVQTLVISNTGELPSNISIGDQPGYTVNDPAPPPAFTVNPDGTVSVDPIYGNRGYVIHYTTRSGEPMVRVWCYPGRVLPGPLPANTVNSVVREMSGGEWNSRCTLTGIPHVIVEFTPDGEVFPGGMPQVSAIVRGKKCIHPTGEVAYSRNPAVAVYDYLRTEFDATADEIQSALAIAARNNCDEPVLAAKRWVSDFPGGPQRQESIIEPRYACDVVLSTEASRTENLRLLLAAMAGTCIWSAGAFDIRAGVAQAAAKSLDDSDFADGPIRIMPHTPAERSFNAVRGRYVQKQILTESEKLPTGAQQTRTRVVYSTTDFPPYKSGFYVQQDQGITNWLEIDLPAVTSAYQAQRIALLQLRQARNALTFEANYKPVMAQFSAGEVVYHNVEALGWVDKPAYLTLWEPQPDGTFRGVWTESAPAIFEPNYTELTGIDPAPNTRLTPATDVEPLAGFQILTGIEYADAGQDGSLRPYALASWTRSQNIGVVNGGRIELRYQFGEDTEWTDVPPLHGSATQYKIPITRNRQIVAQVRAMNGAQIFGPWATESKYADNVPTESIQGNLLNDSVFTYGGTGYSETQLHRWVTATVGGERDYFGPDPVLSPGESAATLSRSAMTILVSKDAATDWQVEVRPERVFVETGTRFVAFADLHVEGGGFAYVSILYIGADGFSIGGELRQTVFPALTGPVRHQDFETVEVFAEVPEGAVYLTLQIGLTRFGVGTTADAKLRIRRPYVGYATPGQIQRPHWTK
jgi:hypothetical protein